MLKTFAVLLLVSGALSTITLDMAYAKAATGPQIVNQINSLKALSQAKKKTTVAKDFGKVPRATLISVCNEMGGDILEGLEGSAACDFDWGDTLECDAKDECVYYTR